MKRKRKNNEIRRKTVRPALLALAAAFLTGLSGCGRTENVWLETESISTEKTEAFTDAESVWRDTADSADNEPDTAIWVHVCGAVSVPGVYELPSGSRIYEAIEAAGGMAEGAAADYLNMAGTLLDGDKVAVPFLSELPLGEQYGGAAAQSGGDPGAPDDGLIDINHAEKELLMTLPGIGEAKAEAVIAYREAHGAFKRPEDIMQVSGIKESAYERLKDKITVR